MRKAPIIIGLTGNIATGKSVVGHMLANSGGLEIDADVVANRLIYPRGAAYHKAVEAFGGEILDDRGLISRRKLAEIVFSNQEQLEKLETLLHPAVTTAIQERIGMTSQAFVVIEAVKLLESDLVNICDSVWVSHASQSHQMERLLHSRKMTETEAEARIAAQSSQSEKLQRADVVINTEGPFNLTWQQVQNGLNDTIKLEETTKVAHIYNSGDWFFPDVNKLAEDDLKAFLRSRDDSDLLDWFALLGSNIILPFIRKDRLKGILFWDNWNFTAALSQWFCKRRMKVAEEYLQKAFERDAKRQQCELIIFSDQAAHKYDLKPGKFGFEHRKVKEISYPGWQEAAAKLAGKDDEKLWMKFLSQPVEVEEQNFNN